MVVHEKPAVFGSWEIWGIDGWYLGHALHHYRCFEFFLNNTAHSRIVDTIEFSPHHFTMPFTSSSDNAMEAAKQLAHDLQNPAPTAPFSQLGDSTMAAIEQLSLLLKKKIFNTGGVDCFSYLQNSATKDNQPIPKSPQHPPPP